MSQRKMGKETLHSTWLLVVRVVDGRFFRRNTKGVVRVTFHDEMQETAPQSVTSLVSWKQDLMWQLTGAQLKKWRTGIGSRKKTIKLQTYEVSSNRKGEHHRVLTGVRRVLLSDVRRCQNNETRRFRLDRNARHPGPRPELNVVLQCVHPEEYLRSEIRMQVIGVRAPKSPTDAKPSMRSPPPKVSPPHRPATVGAVQRFKENARPDTTHCPLSPGALLKDKFNASMAFCDPGELNMSHASPSVSVYHRRNSHMSLLQSSLTKSHGHATTRLSLNSSGSAPPSYTSCDGSFDEGSLCHVTPMRNSVTRESPHSSPPSYAGTPFCSPNLRDLSLTPVRPQQAVVGVEEKVHPSIICLDPSGKTSCVNNQEWVITVMITSVVGLTALSLPTASRHADYSFRLDLVGNSFDMCSFAGETDFGRRSLVRQVLHVRCSAERLAKQLQSDRHDSHALVFCCGGQPIGVGLLDTLPLIQHLESRAAASATSPTSMVNELMWEREVDLAPYHGSCASNASVCVRMTARVSAKDGNAAAMTQLKQGHIGIAEALAKRHSSATQDAIVKAVLGNTGHDGTTAGESPKHSPSRRRLTREGEHNNDEELRYCLLTVEQSCVEELNIHHPAFNMLHNGKVSTDSLRIFSGLQFKSQVGECWFYSRGEGVVHEDGSVKASIVVKDVFMGSEFSIYRDDIHDCLQKCHVQVCLFAEDAETVDDTLPPIAAAWLPLAGLLEDTAWVGHAQELVIRQPMYAAVQADDSLSHDAASPVAWVVATIRLYDQGPARGIVARREQRLATGRSVLPDRALEQQLDVAYSQLEKLQAQMDDLEMLSGIPEPTPRSHMERALLEQVLKLCHRLQEHEGEEVYQDEDLVRVLDEVAALSDLDEDAPQDVDDDGADDMDDLDDIDSYSSSDSVGDSGSESSSPVHRVRRRVQWADSDREIPPLAGSICADLEDSADSSYGDSM